MIDFMSCQFSHTTADDQRDYFDGPAQRQATASAVVEHGMPAGVYRVADGVLVRVIFDVPRDNVMRIIADNLAL